MLGRAALAWRSTGSKRSRNGKTMHSFPFRTFLKVHRKGNLQPLPDLWASPAATISAKTGEMLWMSHHNLNLAQVGVTPSERWSCLDHQHLCRKDGGVLGLTVKSRLSENQSGFYTAEWRHLVQNVDYWGNGSRYGSTFKTTLQMVSRLRSKTQHYRQNKSLKQQ